MHRVPSKDGTWIAYERGGSGPAVILVGGSLVDPATGRAGRWENAPLARELAVDKLAVYEVPYSIGEEASRRWRAMRTARSAV